MDVRAVDPEDLTAVESAIYDQSFRTLDEQSRILDSLRARAGALIAVANVATAFVGGLALTRGHVTGSDVAAPRLDTLSWAAVGLFLAVVVLSLVTMTPWRNWVFTHHPHGLLGTYLDPGPPVSLSEYRRTITYYNGVHYDANGRRLRSLFALLTGASVCLVTELVIWLWVLAN